MLASGRPVPQNNQPRKRGEGVALVFAGPAVHAWIDGGRQWKAWNSRIVSVTLSVGRNKERLHVISCYAPTFAASREMKDEFYACLQAVLLEIPQRDNFVLLGDFNARTGSRSAGSDWGSVRGPHGYGNLNDAGRELLTFLAINEATVCNTWFQKKEIHRQTWQHPKSKKWHCIDFAITRQSYRRRCLDAAVARGAECNTDHQLLKIKLIVGPRPIHRSRQACPITRRFDVAKLRHHHNPEDSHTSQEQPRDLFQQLIGEKLCPQIQHLEGLDIEEKWALIKSVLCEAAETALGKEKKKYPDWFKENLPRLKPLFTERNRLYLKWRTTGRESDRQKFAKIRSQTRRLVREMKNAWFLAKAMEAQRGRNGGKLVWKCIRDLQHGRVGKVPIRSATVRNEDGSMCTTPEEIQQRWRRHFTSILNTQSSFNEEELREVMQRPPRPSMAEPPTEEEVVKAIGAMKNGKAGGHSGILPEMIKAASSDDLFRNTLVTLVRQVWREETTPTDWRDALLVPIPKKGDLSRCDNWRGISLLDVVGKVAARVLQGRLQLLAEDLLPESQCGFRKERSCTDMIFLIRQLLEKSWEHRAKVFVTFVDLRKAYDSIPRRALWIALGKLGLPESIIHLIRSFHQDMSAQIRLGENLLDPLTVTNGLRQGCCMAPVLFNLYLTVVIERWQGKVKDHPDIGIVNRAELASGDAGIEVRLELFDGRQGVEVGQVDVQSRG